MEHMVYKDYFWNQKEPGDNIIRVIANDDYTQLNRLNGHQMIFYIRCLAKSWDWKNEAIKGCQKIERSIREKVPHEINTYSGIKNWIQANFKSFWDTL